MEINESAFSGLPVDLPVVDGDFIRGSPVAQFLTGQLNGVCAPTIREQYRLYSLHCYLGASSHGY
jgi:hypothetical protein